VTCEDNGDIDARDVSHSLRSCVLIIRRGRRSYLGADRIRARKHSFL